MNKINTKQLKYFGLLIGFTFPILVGFILPTLKGEAFLFWTLWPSILFILTAIFKPKFLLYPYRIWMKLGFFLGWINSKIILSLVFFLILLPTAFIMKLLNHDPLKFKKNKGDTYMEKIEDYSEDLTRIF